MRISHTLIALILFAVPANAAPRLHAPTAPLIDVTVNAQTRVTLINLSKGERKIAAKFANFADCTVNGGTDLLTAGIAPRKVSRDAKYSEISRVYSEAKEGAPFKLEQLLPDRKSPCFNGTGLTKVSMNDDAFLASFGPSLYLHDFPVLPPLPRGKLRNSKADPDDLSSRLLLELVDCLIVSAPAKADRALRNVPGSPDEDEALIDMAMEFRTCALPGVQLGINPIFFRHALGNALFRRAKGWVVT